MVNGTTVAALCCSTLSVFLHEKVAFQENPSYLASLATYFSVQEANVKPACIVSPQSVQDVATIMHLVTKPTLRCQFAIRSGGHSSFAGAANIQNGVTIDLRGLDSVELNEERSLVSVGVGASWGNVYTLLDQYNLSVAGGRAFSVGVGGLSTGGGISYFGPRYGWACDMVLNYVVVLANGLIIHANQQDNPDLLWALRGGTNNFGIVVRVDLQAFQQGNIWGGVVFHELSTTDEQVEALSNFNTDNTYDEYSSLISSFGYLGADRSSFIINNMENTRGSMNPPAFQNFTSMPFLQSTMRMTNMTDLAIETETQQVSGLRETSATLTVEPKSDALHTIVNAWNASVPSVQDIPGLVWAIVLEPLPAIFYARHAKSNALGMSDREGKALMIVMLSVTWSNSDDDERVGKAAKMLIETIQQSLSNLGMLDPFIYLNYAAAWQKPILSYGGAIVEQLLRIREKYDPHRIFTDLVPGGFKIPNFKVPGSS